MSLAPSSFDAIPEETIRVAQAAFPYSTRLMQMRDHLGAIYDQSAFEALYPQRGKPAEAPWRLALITVMQFAEDLTDRAAANAVRSRIDWKYALSLDLTDPGFHYSVLAKFRKRLVSGQAEQVLLDALLKRLHEQGSLKAGGHARTDSTHVLAAIRACNRLECVGETLRAALNDLAVVAPDWLRQQITADWFERYSKRVEESRLPQGETKRYAYAEQIGRDGLQLLQALYHATAPRWLREMPIVEILRQTWVYQYYTDEQGHLRWRTAQNLPPAGMRMDSPYDPDAHYGNKRSVTWTGYKVHMTETCDADTLHVITHVETTEAAVTDVTMTEPIHQALANKQLAPATHIVDAGYVDATLLVQSPRDFHVELMGPVRPDISWQAQNEQAYDISQFHIDWEARQVTCPRGQTSAAWSTRQDRWQNPVISVKFANKTCRDCAGRPLCTKAKTAPRHMTLRPQSEHQVLQAVRQQQSTEAWKAQYDKRAGIEGTLSQGVRAFGLRQCRYRGLPKTRLQHLAIAAAINIDRLAAWLDGRPHAKTRISRFAALAA
jgi:transposase